MRKSRAGTWIMNCPETKKNIIFTLVEIISNYLIHSITEAPLRLLATTQKIIIICKSVNKMSYINKIEEEPPLALFHQRGFHHLIATHTDYI